MFKAKDSGKNILMNYQYNYDKMDNILSKASEHGDYAYDYDDIYCLIDADNPTLDDEALAYDPVGNRLTAQGVAGTWNYNDNNELLGYDNVSYEYDTNGNMTQKTVGGVVTKFFYNTEDRLERVEEGDGTLIAVYYYDPFGRRLWKEVGGVRTYFLYADEGLIGEYDASGAEIKTYGYKPGSTWTTDPLFMKEGGNYYFYHNDHLGIPQKITSTNGAIVWSATYSSFGEADVDAFSTITNNLRFPGQYYDEETGLNFNWNRFYDPQTGRYLRTDPMGLSFGINLFVYAKINPIKNIDYNGLKGCFPGKIGELGIFNNPNGYRFGTSCDWHDKCYAGKTGCETKEQCDEEFLKRMKAVCDGMDIPEVPPNPEPEPGYQEGQSKSDCKRIANDYHYLVKKFGKGSYCSETREENCGPDPSCPSKKKTDCEDVGH